MQRVKMKIGTRLTLLLLLALTPEVAVYTYWTVERSAAQYLNDLKQESPRAIALGLVPAVDNDLRAQEWDQIGDVFRRIRPDGIAAALLGKDGRLRFALPDFPGELIVTAESKVRVLTQATEFEQTVSGRRWFCRVVNLDADRQTVGYLLVAQDWTAVNEDLRRRTVSSVLAALALVAINAAIIPLMARRYVSVPLAELSRRVVRFAKEDEEDRSLGRDELKLLSEEFRRLDEQLTAARADLTERHRRELDLERRLQHADRLATIGTLASGLAHDVGTPMGIIRGRAEYLLGNPGPAKTAEGLGIIISQIDRITRIVRMLLDYARPHEPIKVTCDIRPIVEHALGLVETEATRRSVRLIKELGDRPLYADCAADQLEQVFVNLAVNALDAMTVRGGTLRVSAAMEPQGLHPACLRLAFEDTGPGVPEHHRIQVFTPFFTTKEPGKGTGMGLAVSQTIIHDHDGEITCESNSAGTRFLVTVPAAEGLGGHNGAAATRQ